MTRDWKAGIPSVLERGTSSLSRKEKTLTLARNLHRTHPHDTKHGLSTYSLRQNVRHTGSADAALAGHADVANPNYADVPAHAPHDAPGAQRGTIRTHCFPTPPTTQEHPRRVVASLCCRWIRRLRRRLLVHQPLHKWQDSHPRHPSKPCRGGRWCQGRAPLRFRTGRSERKAKTVVPWRQELA